MKLYMPITIDLYNIYPLRVLNLQQNNIGRGALITLTAAGAVVVPESEALYVYAKKVDGTVVYNTCTLKDNQIQVDFDEQMTAVSGVMQVELQMVDSTGNSITTPIFQINVQKSNMDYQKITSQDSFQALVTMLEEIQKLKQTGLKGDPGEAAMIQIGTVVASDPGADPTVTNSGTEQKAVFDFVLPRGPVGPRGPAGPASASDVTYDGASSGASETNAQEAFDKLYGDITQLTEKMYIAYSNVSIIVDASSDNNADYKTTSVQKDGHIQAACRTSSEPGQPFIRLLINNTIVFEGHGENAAYRYLWSPLFPVKAGDNVTYTITNGVNSGERRLYLYGYR